MRPILLDVNSSSSEESWVLGSDVDGAAHFLLDMHPDLGEPIEQLGMEIEQDDNDTVTGTIHRVSLVVP